MFLFKKMLYIISTIEYYFLKKSKIKENKKIKCCQSKTKDDI